jgi:bifunctional non-homologous end joining protein LigD
VSSVLEIEGRSVSVSNLDKVLWPEAGFTKGAMIDYYVRVAPVLLPYLEGRAVTLRRFPDGIEESGWYQNDCPPGAPRWVRTRQVEWPTGTSWEFCAIDDLATLVWVANLAAVELHPFFFRAERPTEATAVIFDLDPGPPADIVDCCRAALLLRDALEALGLAAFVKTSGSIGLHVVVPLNASHSWAEAKAFARQLAGRLAAAEPDQVVDRQSRALRQGKVLVDWLQNDPMRSTVAPYSLRAHGWPTVSAPVTWDEVERTAVEQRAELLTFETSAALERIERLGDPFRPVLELEQRLPEQPG